MTKEQREYKSTNNKIRQFYTDFLGYSDNLIQDKSDQELLDSLTDEQVQDFAQF